MRDLRAPSADRQEILHGIRPRPNFITPVQNLGGPSPRKFYRLKHAKFGTILMANISRKDEDI